MVVGFLPLPPQENLRRPSTSSCFLDVGPLEFLPPRAQGYFPHFQASKN